MKKIYQKPEVLLVSFQAEEELMASGDIGGNIGGSFGGGSTAPFSVDKNVDEGYKFQ